MCFRLFISRFTNCFEQERSGLTNTAGIKMKATTRKATVVVYPVPVDFCCASTHNDS